MRKIMACLDVGSNSVKLVVGETVKKKLNILAVAEEISSGIKNGIVESPEEASVAISRVITKCEEIIGLSIKQMIVTVPNNMASFNAVMGTINIEAGMEVEGKDISKVIGKAVKSAKLEEQVYICMMPTSFILDGDRVVRDPKGLTTSVLGVRGVMVTTPKENIFPVLTILEKMDIEIIDIALGAIGDYFEFRNKDTDGSVGIIVNLGEDNTTISVFNKGVLTNTSVISVGGAKVDADISYIYKVNKDVSQYIKEKFALAHKNMAQANEVIELENGDDVIKVNQLEVSEIVMSRLDAILKLCKNEINCLTKKQISYIIFTGGLSELRDFNLILEENFGQDAKIGQMYEIGVRSNKYSSSVGLIKYYASNASLRNKDYSIFSLEEQQVLSGVNLDSQSGSMIGKLFGYIFNGQ